MVAIGLYFFSMLSNISLSDPCQVVFGLPDRLVVYFTHVTIIHGFVVIFQVQLQVSFPMK